MEDEKEIEIIIEIDYDGYFERLVRNWIERKKRENKPFKNNAIVIYAVPYALSAVSYGLTETTSGVKHIELCFYSALRSGFGSLSQDEITEIIELL